MADEPMELRRKAEACRLLAGTAESPERKELWLKRADEWELQAANAEKAATA